MRLKIVLSFCVLLSVFGITLLISDGSADKPQKEMGTPVELGVMTEKQKAHSKLLAHKSPREKLTKLVEEGTGDIEIIVGNSPPLGAGPLDDESSTIYPNPYLLGLASDADAVVVGLVTGRTSQVTGDETLIFSDYEVAIEEVLKQSPKDFQQPGNNITVTRLGGAIQLKGRTIRAEDTSFEAFKVSEHYLLFLKFIPATGSYRAFQNGSFYIQGNQVAKMTQHKLWKQIEQQIDLAPFVGEVREAIASLRGGKIDSAFRLY